MQKSLPIHLKKLCWKQINRTGGRNSQGRRAMRYIGGGHKKSTVSSISKEIKKISLATVVSIEYDPNRTAFIALIHYSDGEKRYILAPQGLQVGGTCSGW